MDAPSRNAITITYSPRGALAEIFSRRDPEIVVAGPAGTGKSRAWLEKLHLICQKYPGARVLFLRKTHASLTTSGLVTYANDVLHPADGVEYFGGSKREPAMYKYPNGAKMVIGGLDNAGKVLSTEYDFIYVMECNQITHSEWQKLTTRLRANHMPYRQLAGDCNPDAPNHWIKRREAANHLTLVESRHEDNPIYWDGQKQEWTEKGKEYIARLDSLEGVELQRFRYGRWVAAEGTVYNNWDSTVHVIEPFRIPVSWRRIRVIDFGYTNPFVCLWIALDEDGRMYVYRQHYMSQKIVSEHAKIINRYDQGVHFDATIADHDAEDRATLHSQGIRTIPAKKAITVGIQAVEKRMRRAGDGKPRLFVFRDSLLKIDPRMEGKGKATCLEEEMDMYVWPLTKDDKPIKEAPVDDNNHALDCLRYGVMYADGPMRRAAPLSMGKESVWIEASAGY
jgi:PBSX family phage terminase large subunit